MSAIDDILRQCSGVKVTAREIEANTWRQAYIDYSFFKIGEIELPDHDIFI